MAIIKRPIVIFLTIGFSIAGCVSSNQSNQPKMEEKPKISEEVEPSTDSQSLNCLL